MPRDLVPAGSRRRSHGVFSEPVVGTLRATIDPFADEFSDTEVD